MKCQLTLFALLVACVGGAVAEEPRPIDWKNLQPVEDFSDPFKKLKPQQLRELGRLVRLRRLIAEEKIPNDGPDATEANEIERRLRDAKVNFEWLITQLRAVRRMREIQGSSVDSSIDKQLVRLAGFVIPLKRSEDVVTEFLLVPAFDYCCNAIAPPPNQTVYVRFQDGISVPGRFAAAQITGRIAVGKSKWTVQRDDRPTEFIAAYVIEPEAIRVHAANR